MSLYVRSINSMGSGEDSGGGALQNLLGMTDSEHMGTESNFINQAGVLSLSSTDFETTEDSPAAMSVETKKGKCFVLNGSWTTRSKTIKFWEVLSTATETSTIDANATGSTRIDLICVKIDTGASPDDTASNIATVEVVKGTAGAGAPETPANHLKLYEVSVANGASSILNANITDYRVQSRIDVSSIENTAKARAYLGSTQSVATGSDVTLVLDTEDYDPGSRFNTSTYKYVIPVAGYYMIYAQALFTDIADGKDGIIRIKNNGSTIVSGRSYSSVATADPIPNATTISKLAVNDEITVVVQHSEGVNTDIIAGSGSTFLAIHLLSTDETT